MAQQVLSNLTNGRHAACAVDRNGLRPSRYVITKIVF